MMLALRKLLLFSLGLMAMVSHAQSNDISEVNSVIDGPKLAQDCIVKLYGEGGVRGIEGYQTGLLVSLTESTSSEGFLLTVDSPTLGGGELVAVLGNGDRYTAQVQSTDSRSDLALLRIDLDGETIRCFDLESAQRRLVAVGTTVYALSNTFNIATGNEPITWQRTTISLQSEVEFRKFDRRSRPRQVILLDAVTSNPGSAGGALVDREGRLLGMIGKESRSGRMGSWLNYAIPTTILSESMQLMIGNQSLLDEEKIESASARIPGALYKELGIVLVPHLGSRTPPLVEYVSIDSWAAKGGLEVDDLIVSVQGIPVGNSTLAEQKLIQFAERREPIRVAVLRDNGLVVLSLGGE